MIVLSSDVLVALPGSHGTESELRLALDYGKPTVAYCSSLSSVAHFPTAIPRVTSVAEVESFLSSALEF